jgi:hypothetical protein
MPWTCHLIENPELDENGLVDISKRQVGDMWYLDIPVEDLGERHLSAQYFAENANRQPIVVLMPGRNYLLVDGKCYDDKKGYHDGWIVKGIPPLLTVTPSLNLVGRYHGYITNGVITDDVEGRKFDGQ